MAVRWAIVALWATCFYCCFFFNAHSRHFLTFGTRVSTHGLNSDIQIEYKVTFGKKIDTNRKRQLYNSLILVLQFNDLEK